MARNSYSEDIEGGVRVFLRVTPNASKNEVIGEWRGEDGRGESDIRLGVKVTAPPDKGKANAAVIKLLAKQFGVAKAAVSIVSGETARLKTVEIIGAQLKPAQDE